MAKKKSSSFFHRHKHTRWLLPLLILCFVIFAFVLRSPQQEQQITITNWKTYTNPVGKFTLQYPANWTVTETHELSNRQVDNPNEINTATLKGTEGEIVVQWGPMGFGGGCDRTNNKQLQLKEKVITICNGLEDDLEYWSQIYSPDGHIPPFGAHALSEHQYEQLIEKIFSTLSFTK